MPHTHVAGAAYSFHLPLPYTLPAPAVRHMPHGSWQFNPFSVLSFAGAAAASVCCCLSAFCLLAFGKLMRHLHAASPQLPPASLPPTASFAALFVSHAPFGEASYK